MSRFSLLIAAAGLALLQAAAAHAEPPAPPGADVQSFISPPQEVPTADRDIYRQQATMRYGDLDLSTPEGARAMVDRIRRAVALVCTEPEERAPGRPVDMVGQRNCERNAMNATLANLNDPRVTAAANPQTRLASR
jgi:UrcA family protein